MYLQNSSNLPPAVDVQSVPSSYADLSSAFDGWLSVSAIAAAKAVQLVFLTRRCCRRCGTPLAVAGRNFKCSISEGIKWLSVNDFEPHFSTFCF